MEFNCIRNLKTKVSYLAFITAAHNTTGGITHHHRVTGA
jgi:hypothetical protein